MSTNKTPNFGLSQWQSTDPIRVADFNADNQRIDDALAARTQLVTGSYTGTGKYGKSNPTRLDFAESLGKTPQFIVILESQGDYQLILIRGMTQQVCFYPPDGSTHDCPLTWTDTGVSWYNESNAGRQLNNSGRKYFYLAIG